MVLEPRTPKWLLDEAHVQGTNKRLVVAIERPIESDGPYCKPSCPFFRRPNAQAFCVDKYLVKGDASAPRDDNE